MVDCKHGKIQTFVSLSVFLVLLLYLFTPHAHAAQTRATDLGTMEITGTLDGGKFVLSPPVAENLFDLEGAVYPGGCWKKTVRITNTASRNMYIALISVTSNLKDNRLFDALESKINLKDETIYEGTYGGGNEEAPLTETFQIRAGKSLDFEILVSLSSDYGNSMQGAPLDSTWTFAAYYDYPPPTSRYTVYYEAENGESLSEPKEGIAIVGTTVTESAIAIDGYTVDEAEKSIVIQFNADENIIRFIYRSSDTPNEPLPDEPAGEDHPGGVQTGVDLEDNTVIISALIISIAFFLIAAIYLIKKSIVLEDASDSDIMEDEIYGK